MWVYKLKSQFVPPTLAAISQYLTELWAFGNPSVLSLLACLDTEFAEWNSKRGRSRQEEMVMFTTLGTTLCRAFPKLF